MQVIKSHIDPKLIPLNHKKQNTSHTQKVNELIIYHNSQISIKTETKTHIFFINQITHLQAKSNYTTIFIAGTKPILTSKTLKYWEDEINSPYFFRPHNSTLVNKFHVTEIDNLNSVLTLDSGVRLTISRRMKKGIDGYF